MKATDLVHNGHYRINGKEYRYHALNGLFYSVDWKENVCMYEDFISGELSTQDGFPLEPIEIDGEYHHIRQARENLGI